MKPARIVAPLAFASKTVPDHFSVIARCRGCCAWVADEVPREQVDLAMGKATQELLEHVETVHMGRIKRGDAVSRVVGPMKERGQSS